MNILVLGSGGREHAIAHKIAQSSLCDTLYIAPGNTGTAMCGINISISVNDFDAIAKLCIEKNIQMIVVGPEDPLVAGIYDFFQSNTHLQHIQVVGPSAKGAMLEGSKAFAKDFMQKMNIPTAAYKEFTKENIEAGKKYIAQHSLPIVLKADGPAAGKGVIICNTHQEALAHFEDILLHAKFGESGNKIVIESFLEGIECSVFIITDGKNYLLLPEAKDYKRIGEGDMGLNTGGMGAISPVPFVDEIFMQKVITRIIEPTLLGLQQENIHYHGFIFIGLMSVAGDPYVIEYNCRLGDPETEAILPRIQNDIVPILHSLHRNELHLHTLDITTQSAATVVMVSGGYPENFDKGYEIKNCEQVSNTMIYHAGTLQKENTIVTNGGRVLALTSLSPQLSDAVKKSMQAAQTIMYEKKYYRKDIGYEFI